MSAPTVLPRPRAASPPVRTTERVRSKHSLMVLSHAMEEAFDASRAPGPRLAMGLFQQRSYFDVEAERWGALAASGTTVVVVFAGSVDGLPAGVHGISLEADDPLARRWALLLVDRTVGTTLQAVDRQRLQPGGQSLEAARTFSATWSFVRSDAAGDATSLLETLSDRLPPAVRAAALAAVAPPSRSSRRLEARFTAALTALVEALDRGYDRRRALGDALTTVRRQAEQDPLTGLHNRHYLERFLGSATDGSALLLCALLVHVDHLKTINDRWGHGAGDAALSAVAEVLRRTTRPDDVVVRWGGDEFLVLLPGADPDTGLAAAGRIVLEVRATRMPEPWASVPLSVSVGVSPASPASLPLPQLDEALYAVKAAGRDAAQLVLHEPVGALA